MNDWQGRLTVALRSFWRIRERQAAKSKGRDRGSRGAVTGGAQLDGFIKLFREVLREGGVTEAVIFTDEKRELPGFFRPTKQWDLLVVADGQLLASIECKSQVGSFGNNYNNRAEEAVGNAFDTRAAYRAGAFRSSPKPWLGYFMLLEAATGSLRPVRSAEPHFPVFPEFRDASYAKRYELTLLKLLREGLYDAACLILSDRAAGLKGRYQEPSEELRFSRFAASLIGRAATYAALRGSNAHA